MTLQRHFIRRKPHSNIPRPAPFRHILITGYRHRRAIVENIGEQIVATHAEALHHPVRLQHHPAKTGILHPTAKLPMLTRRNHAHIVHLETQKKRKEDKKEVPDKLNSDLGHRTGILIGKTSP